MNSSTTGERRIDRGQRATTRWPLLRGIAWNICILFSANDAYLRDLARTAADPPETGPRDRLDAVIARGSQQPARYDPDAPAGDKARR
jgi:hypothetical protein